VLSTSRRTHKVHSSATIMTKIKSDLHSVFKKEQKL
jgi:hypothetical protein